MCRGDHGRQIADGSGRPGVLQQRAEQLPLRQTIGDVGLHQLDAEWDGTGAEHGECLRMHVDVDDESVAGRLGHPPCQSHRFGCGGGFVEQRRTGRGEPGEVSNHGLEVEQRFEPALGDFRLVRRVRGVPAGVLQHVAADDRRGDGLGVAQPDHRRDATVAGGEPPQLRQHLRLATRDGQVEGVERLDGVGDGGSHQLVHRPIPDDREHLCLLVGGRSDMAFDKGRVGIEVRACGDR